ncbi:lipid II:glycine glycyltransferase FemX [Ornithinimicrobium avium]|uniref:Peptidoglycan bridge formation glycyltransferase FemA/FemB family protein n=1 Tax=Ornithinimicrobium avium TaxID=2283195 RepID=A0A345NQ87_9MICO|nr:peptidoglycan bridge formation glycyltransferase FemA/FemB family protein [Ornithinimicrobium avium]AXH97195.1 peptidoglycan bridge formation glycyltransferase FemA/FemB family protein [Ornithinimicrobium avium]
MPVLDLTDPDAVTRYDDFVRSHPLRSLTQDLRWGLVKDDWGQEAVYLEEGGAVVAAMTLLVRRLPGGFSVLYAPRGPLVDWDDPDMVHRLLAEAAPLVRKHRAVMTKLDPEVPFTPELDAWLRAQEGWVVKNVGAGKDDLVQPRYCMIVRLQDEDGQELSEEELLAKYDGKARNRVRTGRRKGVVVVPADTEEGLRTFHEIYSFMARRNEITTRGLPYFHRMREAFGDRMRVAHARHEDDVLAASVTVDYHGKLYYLYAGSNDLKRNLAPNQVMNHELMVWGLSRGAESYDMGGVFALDPQDGLYLFKRAFCKGDGGATEFVGEVDVVHNKTLYAVLHRLVPAVQRGRRELGGLASRLRRQRAAAREAARAQKVASPDA